MVLPNASFGIMILPNVSFGIMVLLHVLFDIIVFFEFLNLFERKSHILIILNVSLIMVKVFSKHNN